MPVRRALLLVLLGVPLLATIGLMEESEREESAVRRFLQGSGAPTTTLSVASVAMEVNPDPAENRLKMVSFVNEIIREHPGTDLIFFGEMTLGWVYHSPDTDAYQRSVAEPLRGQTFETLAALARKYRTHISWGMAEAVGEKLFNAQVLVGPEGTLLAVQRKKNLKLPVFTPGESPVAFAEIDGVRVAIAICYDIQSPETRRLVLSNAVDILFLSNADWSEPWDRIDFSAGYQGRLFRSWIVSANRFGVEGKVRWDGHVEIVDPFGKVVASRRSSEGYLFHEIPLHRAPTGVRALLRRTYAVVALPYFVVRHLHTAFGYVTGGSPMGAWGIVAAFGACTGLLVAAKRLLSSARSSQTP